MQAGRLAQAHGVRLASAMERSEAILDQWIARTAEAYPRNATALLTEDPDPFRNPVGYALRRSLSRLLDAVLGEMDEVAIDSALDPIIRIHAAQALSLNEAVGFVPLLKPALQELAPEHNPARLCGRIDRLTVLALEKYQQCRDQMVQIRAREKARAIHLPQRIRKEKRA